MGYHFELFGASHVRMANAITQEQQEALSKRCGQRGISRDDMSGAILYHDLRLQRFYMKTAETAAYGFHYNGSWSVGTVDAFFEELAEFASARGLQYSCPLHLGSSGILQDIHCKWYAAEMDAILEQVKKEGHVWKEHITAEWSAALTQAFHLASEDGYLFVATD